MRRVSRAEGGREERGLRAVEDGGGGCCGEDEDDEEEIVEEMEDERPRR